ncbi:hypothetical protein HJC23_003892 [Cyclotella cryptica]|uniref:Uncharacterized protein n=1 Tax=Cyclotella cryptica TaxID=29204 RepID=A0ABD3PQW2_9STRA
MGNRLLGLGRTLYSPAHNIVRPSCFFVLTYIFGTKHCFQYKKQALEECPPHCVKQLMDEMKIKAPTSVEKSKRLYKSGEEARSLMNSLESDTCGIIQWIGYFCLFQTCEAFALLRFGDPNIAGNMLLPYDNTSNNHHLGIGDIKGALSREQRLPMHLKMAFRSKSQTAQKGPQSGVE